jgi:hypothetical protein
MQLELVQEEEEQEVIEHLFLEEQNYIRGRILFQ